MDVLRWVWTLWSWSRSSWSQVHLLLLSLRHSSDKVSKLEATVEHYKKKLEDMGLLRRQVHTHTRESRAHTGTHTYAEVVCVCVC